jgi:hypothetical protein
MLMLLENQPDGSDTSAATAVVCQHAGVVVQFYPF